MNAQQTSTFAMFGRTEKVLTDNNALWATNVRFAENVTALSANIAAIAIAQREQESDKTGIALDKETARQRLAGAAFEVASAVRSYAADANNRELEQGVKYSESGLVQMSESRLVSSCEIILQQGTAHLAALADYGLTAAILAELKAAIDTFIEVLPDTRLAINTGSMATERMRKLFSATSSLLKRQLDTKMVGFRKTNEAFYTAYTLARNVIEPGAALKPKDPTPAVTGK